MFLFYHSSMSTIISEVRKNGKGHTLKQVLEEGKN